LAALKLGYTRSIPEIYQVAGIKFDFGKEYIQALINFLRQEVKKA
jgi:oligoendopeptidase F